MGPACFIANILKTPRPNCMEVGEFLQYCMLNAVITNVRNFTSVAELKQELLMLGRNCCSRLLTEASTNGVVAFSA